MTGRSNRFRFDQQRITITVDKQSLDMEMVTRHFSFLPQSFPFSTPKMYKPRLPGVIDRIPIHKSEHKDGATSPILNHCRDQSMFIKLEGVSNFSVRDIGIRSHNHLPVEWEARDHPGRFGQSGLKTKPETREGV